MKVTHRLATGHGIACGSISYSCRNQTDAL